MKNKLIKILAVALALITLSGCTPAGDSETSAIEADITPEFTESSTVDSEPTETEAPETTEEETTEEVTTDPMEGMTNPYTPLNYEDIKAIWLSQFDLNSVYCSGSAQNSETIYRKYLDKILDNVAENGFNTVIVQVRPNADSMYPSEYYPMSKYVVGSYGKTAKYDPFAIMIEEAHERKLSVQAWINPMRAMTTSEIASVSNDYLIKQWYKDKETKGKYVVANGSNYYLNPAYEDVRNLIINGAREILLKYEVDGLHMDDYFYPTTESSFDAAAYKDYKANGGKKSQENFRKENLNLLVSGLWQMTKSVNPDMIFGISPAGNINNVRRDGADVDTWCSCEGYIDYICPQVYFGLEHQNYDFVKVCKTFSDIIKTDKVKLVIGMTLGKAKSGVDNYAGTGKNEWAEHKDILKRCLEHTESLDKCIGVAYFCYQYFYSPTSGAEVKETKTERDNFIPVLKEISWK